MRITVSAQSDIKKKQQASKQKTNKHKYEHITQPEKEYFFA